jgi:sec-independent protein translocase protein TatB
MEILGVGAPEFAFIIVIALIVLGPRDMQKAGKTIGRWLNQLVHSDNWQVFQKTSRELRNLPTNLMREANYEMMKTDEALRQAVEPGLPPSNRAGTGSRPRLEHPENTIRPPDEPPGQQEPDA